MNRFGLAIVTILALAASGLAHGAERYRTLEGPQPGDDPGTIEVREFFWYGCPHCNKFRTHIAGWKKNKPDGVTFSHVPAVFRASWAVHARAFYAAKVMGVLERFHQPMFRAIHEQGRRLNSEEAIGKFVDELGIDRQKFVDTMNSFAVNSRVKRAKQLQQAYGISGTPSVVVDARYVVSPNAVGSFDGMIRVINDRVAALRGGSD